MFKFYFGGKINNDDFEGIMIKNYIGINGLVSIRGGYQYENLDSSDIEKYISKNNLKKICIVLNSSYEYDDYDISKIKVILMNNHKMIDSIIISTEHMINKLYNFCKGLGIKIEIGMTFFLKNKHKFKNINDYVSNVLSTFDYVVLPPEESTIDKLRTIDPIYYKNIIVMALDDCLFDCKDRYRHQVEGSGGCTVNDTARDDRCSYKMFNESYYKEIHELGIKRIKVSSRTSFKSYDFWIKKIKEVNSYVL